MTQGNQMILYDTVRFFRYLQITRKYPCRSTGSSRSTDGRVQGKRARRARRRGTRAKSRSSPVRGRTVGLGDGQRLRRVTRQSVGPRRWRRRRRFPGGGLPPGGTLTVLAPARRASRAIRRRVPTPLARAVATLPPAIEAGPLVAPEPRQPAPGASRALRRIYQGALRAMPLQHRRDRAHSPRVVMAPPLRRSISPLSRPRTRRRRRRRQRRQRRRRRQRWRRRQWQRRQWLLLLHPEPAATTSIHVHVLSTRAELSTSSRRTLRRRTLHDGRDDAAARRDATRRGVTRRDVT